MKFNTKTRYGLRTMMEIAMQGNGVGVLQKEISERQEISFKYLDPIIASLKASGLIVNADGRMSGYKLAKDPGKISIYDIYKAFERELLIADCLIEERNGSSDYYCAAKEFWRELNELMVKYFQSIKLEDLAEKQKVINEQKKEHMFFI